MGSRLHDHLARAGLRLPRRDPLCRRRNARHARRTVHDQERDLRSRRGQCSALEARRPHHRRGGTPDAPVGRVVPCDGRQLRVPRLLALLPGRQHRVRGPGDRPDGDDPVRRRRYAARDRDRGRQANVCPVPPALPGRPARSGRRRCREHRVRGRLPGAARVRSNPYGLAVVTDARPVRSESESARDFNWSTQRSWKVVNPNRVNAVGSNRAYKLVPSASIPPLMDPETPQYLRAPMIGHTVWVTRQHDTERWPCGAYPTQSTADAGMTRGIADDEPLENPDVVLWYVSGIHHITRVEDWPVMPADTVAFWLKPFGFFDQNPSIDVAPSVVADGEACEHSAD